MFKNLIYQIQIKSYFIILSVSRPSRAAPWAWAAAGAQARAPPPPPLSAQGPESAPPAFGPNILGNSLGIDSESDLNMWRAVACFGPRVTPPQGSDQELSEGGGRR